MLRRAARWFLLALAALVLAYEEIQWRLAGLYALLGRLPWLRLLEARIRKFPPYAALALFALPSLLLLPLKLLAMYWLASGQRLLGFTVIVTAKVLGTALVARIFQLTQTALLTIGWCRWVYDHVLALREAAYAVWRKMPIVRWWRIKWKSLRARWNWRRFIPAE